MISNVWSLYELTNRLIMDCRMNDCRDIAEELENAKCLGSSGLEIVGAIGKIITDNRHRLMEFENEKELRAAIAFVDRCYGRSWWTRFWE